MVTKEAEGVMEGVFIVAEMGDHVAKTVAKIKKLIETEMIPIRSANLLKNTLWPHLYRLQ